MAPGELNRVVGYFQLAPDVVETVTRNADHLFSQLTGRLRYELFPGGSSEYFLKAADFHGTFTVDSQGNVVEVIVRHDGFEQVGKRIDAVAARAAEDYAQTRLAENVPLPGSEATLRRVLDELRASPDYGRMTPILAGAVRRALSSIQEELGLLGKAMSLEFIGVGSRGTDVYVVHFSNGDAEWRIRLTSEGKLEWLEHHPLKDASRLPMMNVSTLQGQPPGEPTTIEFLNKTNIPLQVYWIDPEGALKARGSVDPDHLKTQPCYVSELFVLGRDERHPVAIFRAAPGLTIGRVN